MDFSTMSRKQLEQFAEDYYQKYQNAQHNAELYLNQLNRLKNDKYGKKSEKISTIQPTLDLFDEADELAAADEYNEKRINVKSHSRKPKINAMNHLPEDIETEVIEHDIEDKTCSKCGGQLHLMNVIERKELVVIPRKVKLLIHKIYEYGCRNCEKNDDCGIIKAPGPQLLFDKSPVSIETVGYLMDMKYNLGVPLKRIESAMKVEGIIFPRNTYARWMIETAKKYLMVIYDHLHKKLLDHDLIMADETHYRIYGEKGKKRLGKTYIWIYRTGPYVKHPIILYQYDGGRNGNIPKSFLTEYSGYLLTDDYSGYNKVTNVTRCLCHAHSRRKYVENIKGKGKNVHEDMPEIKIVEMYKKVFEADKKLSEKYQDNYAKIRELRNQDLNENGEDISVKAKLDDLYKYLEKLYDEVMPGSPLYQALSYSISNKEWLYNFLDDGRIPLTNNLTELSVKPVINVRKSAIFFGSPDGARSSACILSLIQTAKENGISPYRYICTVLKYMVERKDDSGNININEDELESLMPWNIKKAQVSKT